MNHSISQSGGDNVVQIGYVEHVDQMNIGGRVLKVNISSLIGGVINIASQDVYIAPTPRSAPVYLFPRPFPLLRGREEEVKAAVSLLPYEQSVEFHGLAGIGKTALLRHLAHHPIIKSAFPDGLIYHRVTYGQTVTDILQVLFNAFYDCKTPTKACDSEIHRVLQGRKALIVLDGLELKREELDRLINYLPSFTFLITGFEQHLWGEAKSVGLQGLPLSAALALVAQELGRQLQPAEQAGAEKLCMALEGHPLKILQAVAWAKAERKSLVAIAQQVSTAAAKEIWAATLLASLSKPQRWIIALLAALGANIALGAEAISSITGLADAKAILEALLQRQLVEIDGGRVRLASSLLKELQQQSALTSWMERTSSFLIQWVQQHKNSPDAILQESDAILRTLEWAAEAGRWSDVITLGCAIEGGLALSGQWGSWETVLQSVLEAARATGDQAVEAFALHELGTRSLCLNQLNEAQTYLSQALQIRGSLGDQEAIEATTHNLELLSTVPPIYEPAPSSIPQASIRDRSNISKWLGIATPAILFLVLILVFGSKGSIGDRFLSIGEKLLSTERINIAPPPKGDDTSTSLSSFEVTPSEIRAAESSEGTVILSRPAPNDIEISLSSDKEGLDFPGTIIVKAGESKTSFSIETSASSDTREFEITSSYQEEAKTARLIVNGVTQVPPVTIEFLKITPSEVSAAEPSEGTITLSSTTPNDIEISLSSDKEGLDFPGTIIVKAGESKASFSIKTSASSDTREFEITSSYQGEAKTARLTVNGVSQVPPVAIESLEITPSEVKATEPSEGTITLSRPAPNDVDITLSSSDQSRVTVPEKVTILAGNSNATFSVTTGYFPGTTTNISASYGRVTRTVTLTIDQPPIEISSLSIDPQEITAKNSSKGTINLSRPTPNDIVVNLSSDNQYVIVPSSILIPAGKSTETFEITTKYFAEGQVTVNITAYFQGITRTTSLTVNGAGPD